MCKLDKNAAVAHVCHVMLMINNKSEKNEKASVKIAHCTPSGLRVYPSCTLSLTYPSSHVVCNASIPLFHLQYVISVLCR